MKLTYDPDYNIAYIRFRPKSPEVLSIKISDEFIVDLGKNGMVYGIELLNANEQLQQCDDGRIIFINEQSGEEVNIPIAVGGR